MTDKDNGETECPPEQPHINWGSKGRWKSIPPGTGSRFARETKVYPPESTASKINQEGKRLPPEIGQDPDKVFRPIPCFINRF